MKKVVKGSAVSTVKKLGKSLSKNEKTVAKKKKKNALPVFKAPGEMKPFFLLVTVASEKDGLLAGKIKATRFVGRFDPDAPAKKKFELSSYDVNTLLAVQSRLAAVTYKPSVDKKYPALPKERKNLLGSHRLPASTTFQVLMRVGRNVETKDLKIGIKEISQFIESSKTGRTRPVLLEKTDPVYRALRKSARILPAAFQNCQEPPKKTRGQVEEE